MLDSPLIRKVALVETLVSFAVRGLFTGIPVPVALEVIHGKFTDHINQTGIENVLEHTCLICKDKIELVLLQSLPTFTWNTLKK